MIWCQDDLLLILHAEIVLCPKNVNNGVNFALCDHFRLKRCNKSFGFFNEVHAHRAGPVTDLPLDVHLMIDRPVRYVEQFCDAGGDLITCHVEADTEENIHSAIVKIHAKGKKAGVVVKPKTPASAVLPFINEVELILVMTVEPGFGGQRFMADMMPKVQEIRRYIDAMNPTCELEVDGGVDPATCKLCTASGANVLVAGSSVYKAEDIPARIRELRG